MSKLALFVLQSRVFEVKVPSLGSQRCSKFVRSISQSSGGWEEGKIEHKGKPSRMNELGVPGTKNATRIYLPKKLSVFVPRWPTKEEFYDLSRYLPNFDNLDDTTLPGGNPYRKYDVIVDQPIANENVLNAPDPELEAGFSESLGITFETFKKLKKKVLIIKRTSTTTAKGKIPSMNALVVVGNGKGAAGFGEAKNDEIGNAILKATNRAIKNMAQFERYDNRTIYHDIHYKFKATELKLFARPPGFGVRTNHNIHEICQCIGISDLAGKVYGSRNSTNVIKAFFGALLTQKTPSEIAKSRGKKMVDVQFQYYGIKTKYSD